ncbi:hypothetical protein KR50_31550 [Jeotgalibacillus campisalis]|uniref:Uncharacterized protein n=1 Tax=Jeotgalibacillus campisalis TaxID=220754 RepID=A0A0C2V516_9BACL|nr:hypothetical protein KR50_31550 [Jeotgalibacillus campisalis]
MSENFLFFSGYYDKYGIFCDIMAGIMRYRAEMVEIEGHPENKK